MPPSTLKAIAVSFMTMTLSLKGPINHGKTKMANCLKPINKRASLVKMFGRPIHDIVSGKSASCKMYGASDITL